MIDTAITRRFGLTTPILNAGMAMVARPDLAAAVSNAGGLGMIGADVAPAEALRAMVRAVKSKTDRPFGVDLLAPMITDAHLDVLAEEGVALCVVFWGNPTRDQVARIKAGGAAFWMQVGSVEEARDAQALGAEAIIAQGLEGGGHIPLSFLIHGGGIAAEVLSLRIGHTAAPATYLWWQTAKTR